jgi:predicted DCC family thiol-disulfide oxidoreductase YuxK
MDQAKRPLRDPAGSAEPVTPPGAAPSGNSALGDRVPSGGVIVFFDGLCGMCNRWVDVMLRLDRRGRLRFAPLQGATAQALLPAETLRAAASLALLDGRGIALRSEAAIRALTHLGGPWRLAGGLRLVPRRARDAAYDFIAARRYRWFGRRAACRVPTPAEQPRFLP